jgi:hypothetical protein
VAAEVRDARSCVLSSAALASQFGEFLAADPPRAFFTRGVEPTGPKFKALNANLSTTAELFARVSSGPMPEARLPPRDRRIILEQLTRDRLNELSTRFELNVHDRRSTDAHIDAIVRKRSLDFRRVLELLRREEHRHGPTASARSQRRQRP